MSLIIEPKYDGQRLIIHRRGDDIKIFTEDKKRDRAQIFPQLIAEIKKNITVNFIIDCEFVQWIDNMPILREKMIWIIVGKQQMKDDIDLRVNAHDCLWYDESAINLEPYKTHLEFLRKLIPGPLKYLRATEWWEANTRSQFDVALKKAYAYPGSEGAMVKDSASIYDPNNPRTADWAKIKKAKEVAVQIIGIQRKALPFSSIGMKTPIQNIEGEEALKIYKRLTERSNSFIFRCALRDKDKILPIESKKVLTQSDFEVRWNAELDTPKWQGLDAPQLWEMAKAAPEREAGDFAYGNTYVFKAVPAPKLGDIITVIPVQILRFKDKSQNEHLSWMFPRVKERDPDKSKPDDIKDIESLITREDSGCRKPIGVGELTTTFKGDDDIG